MVGARKREGQEWRYRDRRPNWGRKASPYRPRGGVGTGVNHYSCSLFVCYTTTFGHHYCHQSLINEYEVLNANTW